MAVNRLGDGGEDDFGFLVASQIGGGGDDAEGNHDEWLEREPAFPDPLPVGRRRRSGVNAARAPVDVIPRERSVRPTGRHTGGSQGLILMTWLVSQSVGRSRQATTARVKV